MSKENEYPKIFKIYFHRYGKKNFITDLTIKNEDHENLMYDKLKSDDKDLWYEIVKQ